VLIFEEGHRRPLLDVPWIEEEEFREQLELFVVGNHLKGKLLRFKTLWQNDLTSTKALQVLISILRGN